MEEILINLGPSGAIIAVLLWIIREQRAIKRNGTANPSLGEHFDRIERSLGRIEKTADKIATHAENNAMRLINIWDKVKE